MLKIIHAHKHKTSIFDDFFHYELKQYGELLESKQQQQHRMIESPPPINISTSNNKPFNKPDNKLHSNERRDTSLPIENNSHNLNNKGNLLSSSNYEPSSSSNNTSSNLIKKSWAEQCEQIV